jgi:hypothetical protein
MTLPNHRSSRMPFLQQLPSRTSTFSERSRRARHIHPRNTRSVPSSTDSQFEERDEVWSSLHTSEFVEGSQRVQLREAGLVWEASDEAGPERVEKVGVEGCVQAGQLKIWHGFSTVLRQAWEHSMRTPHTPSKTGSQQTMADKRGEVEEMAQQSPPTSLGGTCQMDADVWGY